MTFPRNKNTPPTKTSDPSAITRVRIIHSAAERSFQRSLQKLQSFHRDVVAVRLDLAPDGSGPCDDLDVGGEGLNHHIAVVFDRFERGGDGFAVNVIVSRCAAITAAG